MVYASCPFRPISMRHFFFLSASIFCGNQRLDAFTVGCLISHLHICSNRLQFNIGMGIGQIWFGSDTSFVSNTHGFCICIILLCFDAIWIGVRFMLFSCLSGCKFNITNCFLGRILRHSISWNDQSIGYSYNGFRISLRSRIDRFID